MEIKGELLRIKYPANYGKDYVVVRSIPYSDFMFTIKLNELVELSQLTEALLQEVDSADKSNRRD